MWYQISSPGFALFLLLNIIKRRANNPRSRKKWGEDARQSRLYFLGYFELFTRKVEAFLALAHISLKKPFISHLVISPVKRVLESL